MSIHYTCQCGAHIRLPGNVVGKRARCNSCKCIFTVPDPALNAEPDTIPIEPEPAPPPPPSKQPVADDAPAPVGQWLDEFAEHEAGAEAAPVANGAAQPDSARPATSGPLLDFADEDEDDILAPVPTRPRITVAAVGASDREDARSGVLGPTKPYWVELATSFFFFLDAGSFITFLIIVLINMWTIPLSYGGLFGQIGLFFVWGYLCTFYMGVIRETAAGEDELPNVWITSVLDDLVMPFFHFLGTWLAVLAPAAILAVWQTANGMSVNWPLVQALAAIGLFFWPVMILGVAIGHGFSGLWPHTIVQTALAAPLAYLAMYGMLLIAAAITVLPYTDVVRDGVEALSTSLGRNLIWVLAVVGSAVSAYSWTLAMRIIGLYYRHFKHKFPWVAE